VLYTSDCTTGAPVTVGEERVPGVDEIIRTSLREDDDELMLFTVGSSFDFLVCVFIRCFCSLFVLLLVLVLSSFALCVCVFIRRSCLLFVSFPF